MVLLYVSKFKGFCHVGHDNTWCVLGLNWPVMKLDIGFQILSSHFAKLLSFLWLKILQFPYSCLKWVYIISLLTLCYFNSEVFYRFSSSFTFIFNANKYLLRLAAGTFGRPPAFLWAPGSIPGVCGGTPPFHLF